MKVSIRNLNSTDYNPSLFIRWDQMADQPGQADREFHLYLDPSRQYQMIEGFGGAFSELGSRALQTLSEAKQESLLRTLYTDAGAHLTWGRIPIGASDFAIDAYSALDGKDFDLNRDRQYLLPFLHAALKHNPKMRFHASPWSPPACFKDNHSMLGGGRLIPTDGNYAAYAAYLADYVQAMAAEGVNIERLMPQNEPDAATRYPSCLMNVDEMARLVADYLVPEFEKRALSTEIWAGTFRTITGLHALDALDNAALHGNIHGIGIQYSVKDLLWEVVRKYPDIPVMHTESACYNGQNTMEQSIILFDDIIDSFNIGCRVYTYWNTILPENGLSSWGWKQNSLVSVMDNGEIRYNPDFNIIKLWSQSLGCRARRISSLCLKRKHFAAILPDGKIVLIFLNHSADHEKYMIHGLSRIQEVMVEPFTAMSVTLK